MVEFGKNGNRGGWRSRCRQGWSTFRPHTKPKIRKFEIYAIRETEFPTTSCRWNRRFSFWWKWIHAISKFSFPFEGVKRSSACKKWRRFATSSLEKELPVASRSWQPPLLVIVTPNATPVQWWVISAKVLFEAIQRTKESEKKNNQTIKIQVGTKFLCLVFPWMKACMKDSVHKKVERTRTEGSTTTKEEKIGPDSVLFDSMRKY